MSTFNFDKMILASTCYDLGPPALVMDKDSNILHASLEAKEELGPLTDKHLSEIIDANTDHPHNEPFNIFGTADNHIADRRVNMVSADGVVRLYLVYDQRVIEFEGDLRLFCRFKRYYDA